MIGLSARKVYTQRGVRAVSQALSATQAWNQAPAVVTTLSNGVRVATRETYNDVATVGVFLDAGVRDEVKEGAGAASALEKLSLAGTKNRSKAQLESEVEGLGALLESSTGREQSSFRLTLNRSDLRQGVDIVSDLVTGRNFSNWSNERDTIAQALEEQDTPTRCVIEDRLHTVAFRDTSLGFSAFGEDAGKLTAHDLEAFASRTHTGDNIVLSAVGPVNHQEMVRLAEASFAHIPSTIPTPVEARPTKPYFCGAELIYRNDEMGPKAYISVGWESVSWKSPDAVAFMLMRHIIGSYKKGEGLLPGNLSGNRTINNIANKMAVGCADEFTAFSNFYRDTGMFGWYAVCDEVAVEHCIGELMFGANLMSFAVTEEEVERAKRELKQSLFGGSGSSASACAELGEQVLAYGRGLPPAEMLLRIDAIDSEEVKRIAWKYLNDNEIAVTGLGPLHGMPTYYDLRRQTTMHRY